MKSIILVLLVQFGLCAARCLLCENGVEGLRRPAYNVDSKGTQCARKIHDIFPLAGTSDECTWEIVQHREPCCGEAEPPIIAQAPTVAPATLIQHTGNYPSCDICYDETFPGNPAMVINMLNIGTGSCRQFFEVGRAGMIVPHLCQTLQSFAYSPCGCGSMPVASSGSGTSPSATPYPTISATNTPTKHPTVPPTKPPTSSPTKAPFKSPTRRPTPPPTAAPTPSPTKPPTKSPTRYPTPFPTKAPTKRPTLYPTPFPTTKPTPDSNRPLPTPFPTTKPTPDFNRPLPTPSPTSKPTPDFNRPLPTPSPTTRQLAVASTPTTEQRTPDNDGKDSVTGLSSSGGSGGVRLLKGSSPSRGDGEGKQETNN